MKRKIITRQNDLFGSYEHFSRDELINLIDREIAKVPEEYKHTVKFAIDTSSEPYDDDAQPKFFIQFARPETDEEFEIRTANEKNHAKLKEEHDRKLYAKLKKQFEGKS
jgi:hypothetical protein